MITTVPAQPSHQPASQSPGRASLQQPLASPSRFFSTPAPWQGLAYFLVSTLIGWALFFLYIVVILLPFAPAWSYGLAKIERLRVTWMGVEPIGDPHPRVAGSLVARAGTRLGERATWREVLYSLIMAVVIPVVSSIALIGWFVGLGLLVGPFISDEVYVLGTSATSPVSRLFWGCVGAIVCAVGLYVTYAVSALQVATARLLLGPSEEELARRVSVLETSRGVLVTSFEDERRRIERNLHDGPQQDLVSLSLQLGELQQALSTVGAADGAHDSAELAARVSAAQSSLERAMAGLRDTVRGVHPQVLDDEGIEAACAELGGAIRVDVSAGPGWEPGRRLAADVEQAMYYTASEAVTNAIKHGGASRVSIEFSAEPPTMTVMDDGVGGADPARGTGLAGLVERAESIGATLTVLSPSGGPTTLHWRMP